MFLGSRVDDALSLYYRRILEHHERLELAQVKDAYRDLWHTGLETEEQQLGVDWQDIPQHEGFEQGLQALELTFEQLVPKLGEPLAVQRRLEFTLAPGLTEWTVVCYLDLETRARAPSGEPLDRVVDYKVKGSPIGQQKADRDPQASLYLAGRWLEGRPVFRIRRYHTLTYPGQGFTRWGASFQGGVPSEARLTFRRRARSRSCRCAPAGVSPVPGPRRRVGVLDGLRRGV